LFYQIKSYIKFLFKSTNQHGVHSPFVYKLVTECFYNKAKFDAYATLNDFRKKLKADTELILVTDFGAGSRVFKTDKRMVKAIANTAGITKKRQQLLYRLANYFKPKITLELGTSLGLASTALALGNPLGEVVSVEGCGNTAAKATHYFETFNLKNVMLHTAVFDDFLAKNNTEYDFVYIDGNHSKEATLRYFNMLRKRVNSNSVFVFDDIYWNPEMTAAWHEIISNEQVTVSIDTFQWGLVFFRKEQKKEHFTIRV